MSMLIAERKRLVLTSTHLSCAFSLLRKSWIFKVYTTLNAKHVRQTTSATMPTVTSTGALSLECRGITAPSCIETKLVGFWSIIRCSNVGSSAARTHNSMLAA